ncbi:hypothetical protein GCM10027051_31330 [Niabella terrae]
MDIQAYHSRIRFLIDKAQGGYFNPSEIDTAIDMASLSLFNSFDKVYGKNTSAVEALAPFKVDGEWVQADATGTLTTAQPSIRLLSATVKPFIASQSRYRGVKIVNEDELSPRLESQVRKVDSAYPVLVVLGGSRYQMYPNEPIAVRVSYLRRPMVPVFNYTLEAGSQVVFNPVGSVAPEWSDVLADAVIVRAIAVLGVNLDSQFLASLGAGFWQEQQTVTQN